jgi:hypothetical protein
VRFSGLSAVTVRPAEIADVDGLARLFLQLGYSGAGDGLPDRLEMMLADPRADVLVAEDGGALLGLGYARQSEHFLKRLPARRAADLTSSC